MTIIETILAYILEMIKSFSINDYIPSLSMNYVTDYLYKTVANIAQMVENAWI